MATPSMSTLSSILLLTLLVVLAGLFLVMHRRDKERLANAQEKQNTILAEERRLFTFLHDLGESLSHDSRRNAIHRLIVEGAQRVTDSGGGALYLLDEGHKSLVPKFYSDECSPLVALPERIVAMAKQNPNSLLSFLRLHAVDKDAGVLGAVFLSQLPEIVTNLKRDDRFGSSNNPLHLPTAAMICPLSCGNRHLGILAVTSPKDRATFDENDFEVFRSLAEQSAYALSNALVRQEAKAKQQIDAELRAASAIQRILLPDQDPKLNGYTVAGQNIPARILSGDFYDYIELKDGRLGLVIADVSGKGTAAALISAMCRAVMRTLAPQESSPAAVLSKVNRQLFPDIREDMFITMAYLVIDPTSGDVSYARAGHTAPLIWRAGTGLVESLTTPGMAVGIDKGDVFDRIARDVSIHLDPGDTLLLYTDGISEATDNKELMFGEDRVERALALRAPQGPGNVVQGLLQELDVFVGGQRSLDDITLIAVQKTA
jgi:sigma-B regulation protein RsbU (phosphoserine phosphatase)